MTKVKKLKTLRVKKKVSVKPRGNVPWISTLLTIAAAICWGFFIYYVYSGFRIYATMTAAPEGGSSWEELLGNIFGIIVTPAIIAQVVWMAVAFLIPAIVLTILFIVGWTRKRAW